MQTVIVAIVEAGVLIGLGYLIYRQILKPNLLRHILTQQAQTPKEADSPVISEEVRRQALENADGELHQIISRRLRELEAEATETIEQKTQSLLLDSMQRSAVEYISEASTSVVELPSEDLKGRLIGREGRNIRAFEQVTGTDLIIDETPDAVVISCFDPIRREIAHLTLLDLLKDSKIHPARIEELHSKAKLKIEKEMLDTAKQALERAGVSGNVAAKALETLGRLSFRASYGQNVLDHSIEVAHIAGIIAHELHLDVATSKRAGLFHDIGKALDENWDGPHALTGMEFLRACGEPEAVLIAVGAHHHDIEPTSPEAKLIIIADTISASRPGARRESLDAYMKRLSKLEAIAKEFPGVEHCYAVQSGREVRLLVKPEMIDDLAAQRLARDVANRIGQEVEGPGQVKVTVIRETRFTETAK